MTNIWDKAIQDDLDRVSAIIRETCASPNPIVKEGVSALFDGGGKLLRPGLLLIAASFGKRQEKRGAYQSSADKRGADKLFKLAACLEMLHMATLVHDDVIDDSPLRRGAPACHVRFGKRDAVLIGDFLLSRCFLLAAEYTSPENALNIGKLMSRMCIMEIEQNSDRFCSNFSMRRYLRKIMGKSAALFALACHVGASEAKAPASVVESLHRAGYNIGMAFQIIDDILDYSGDPSTVRKSLGNDIKEGLVTLPLICALSLDTGGSLRPLFSCAAFTVEDSGAIVRAVNEAGGVDASRAVAYRYTERALREIGGLPAGEARDALERLTRALLIRDA